MTNISCFVAFKSTTTSDVLIQWEESNIPPNYLLNNGHCRLATISDDRLFIAVAADRGLCILDLSQRSHMKDSRQSHSHGSHWKLFSRVNEEQSFRVLHMVWWDRNENNPQSERSNARSDHFLIAVIQYAHSDVLYLAGWSCKRRVVSYHMSESFVVLIYLCILHSFFANCQAWLWQ